MLHDGDTLKVGAYETKFLIYIDYTHVRLGAGAPIEWTGPADDGIEK